MFRFFDNFVRAGLGLIWEDFFVLFEAFITWWLMCKRVCFCPLGKSLDLHGPVVGWLKGKLETMQLHSETENRGSHKTGAIFERPYQLWRCLGLQGTSSKSKSGYLSSISISRGTCLGLIPSPTQHPLNFKSVVDLKLIRHNRRRHEWVLQGGDWNFKIGLIYWDDTF